MLRSLGFLLIPASWLFLSVVYPSAIGAVYIAWASSYCVWSLATTSTRSPGGHMADRITGTHGILANLAKRGPDHAPIRIFASMHLLALYIAMCGQLPGLEALQRPELEGWLRAIGLWDPQVSR